MVITFVIFIAFIRKYSFSATFFQLQEECVFKLWIIDFLNKSKVKNILLCLRDICFSFPSLFMFFAYFSMTLLIFLIFISRNSLCLGRLAFFSSGMSCKYVFQLAVDSSFIFLLI